MNKVALDDIFGIPFYKCKQPFFGSLGKIRYRIIKADIPIEEGAEETKSVLELSVWIGEYCYDATDKEIMTIEYFEFSEKGLEDIVNWINDYAGKNA